MLKIHVEYLSFLSCSLVLCISPERFACIHGLTAWWPLGHRGWTFGVAWSETKMKDESNSERFGDRALPNQLQKQRQGKKCDFLSPCGLDHSCLGGGLSEWNEHRASRPLVPGFNSLDRIVIKYLSVSFLCLSLSQREQESCTSEPSVMPGCGCRDP